MCCRQQVFAIVHSSVLFVTMFASLIFFPRKVDVSGLCYTAVKDRRRNRYLNVSRHMS